ncbi:neuroligin- y-linked-like protein [Dinothrombium tinctorium]|uniref:Neuroligin-y-linked-like protein n=2 Tax=Dinothrombium tinctorium TaxID=1965070 RepID=A0A3S3PIA5_9ACAR|nr:neuroligin- y-linked-like protein [Dinothrombium tinctorium]
MRLLLLFVVYIIESVLSSSNLNADKLLSPRTVKTKYGSLRGVLISLSDDKPSSADSSNSQQSSLITLASVEAFLGVPYATPPIGSLRFMPPVTLSHWRGTRLANKLSPVCPQKLPSGFTTARNHNSNENKPSSTSNSNTAGSNTASSSSGGTGGGGNRNDGKHEYIARILPFLEQESEDCLYLNIYLPFAKAAN